MTATAIVVIDGTTYRADGDARSIEPADDVSAVAVDLLETGEPIGPQIDELAGVFGTWDQYPKSAIAALLDAADRTGGDVTWYADDGTEPPA